MSFTFKTLEHALASAAQEAHSVLKAVGPMASKLRDELTKAGAAAPLIETATQVVVTAATGNAALGLTAEELERAAFSALGMVTKAADDTSAAANSGYVNVQMDAAALSDFRTLATYLKAVVAAKGGVTAPATA